jgi:translation initiation factor eIF-2B subunit alpha
MIGRQQAAAMFVAAGIPTLLIADCAVGTYMERVDLCIVGAEGVMENGGIVNKVVVVTLKCIFCMYVV